MSTTWGHVVVSMTSEPRLTDTVHCGCFCDIRTAIYSFHGRCARFALLSWPHVDVFAMRRITVILPMCHYLCLHFIQASSLHAQKMTTIFNETTNVRMVAYSSRRFAHGIDHVFTSTSWSLGFEAFRCSKNVF